MLSQTKTDTHPELRVREAYVGVSLGEVDLTAGRQLVRWGAGYAFTATEVLDPQRVATDPTDRLNLNEGRDMVKADWIRGKGDLSLAYALGARDTLAARYNIMEHGFDTSIVVAHDRRGVTTTGVNVTRVFGDSTEVHGEFAWRRTATGLFGGKYTHASGVSVIAELYSPTPAMPGRQFYGFVRVAKARLRELPGWKEWDAAGSLVTNLKDHSHAAVFDVSRRLGNHLSVYAHALVPAGKKWRSEFGMIPYASLVSVGIRFQM
jgi:hypothetical protein